jgi:hypothetical protein
MFDPEEKSRSFADQLGDAMSFDPDRQNAAGNTMADAISQSLANSLAGNHPASDRTMFGSGSFASRMTQNLLDDTFSNEEE